MSDKDEDLDVDSRLQDGWNFRVHFIDGSVEYFRDHDNLASVRARLVAAKESEEGGRATFIDFSGAKEVEGLTEEGASILGSLRGKGFAEAKRVQSIVYSASDGTEASSQAYEAAVALLDVQRAALSALQEQVSGGKREQGDEGSEGLLG